MDGAERTHDDAQECAAEQSANPTPDPAHAQAREQADDRECTESHGDGGDQRTHAGLDRTEDVVAEASPGLVREVESKHDANDHRQDKAEAERSGKLAPACAEGSQNRRSRDRDRQLKAEQDAPTKRPEEPVAHEEHGADRHEDADEEEHPENDPGGEGEPRDLRRDPGEFGLSQRDVGAHEPYGGASGGPDLLTKTGWLTAGCGGIAARKIVQGAASGHSLVHGTGFGSYQRHSGFPANGPGERARPTITSSASYPAAMNEPAYTSAPSGTGTRRILRTAELLSIGTELTVGDTRDTNAGELAHDLSGRGVQMGRLTAVPDRLEVVSEAFTHGLGRSDLVVSTGGLGPTPDDLTREAIASVMGETPSVDPDLEAWLRELWTRRGMAFPTMNLKQAWLIPSGTAIPNPNGTAPGWWIDTLDGRVIVALPGPPREMRPMWRDWVLPRLAERGLGGDFVARTYRLTGIGESAVADQLGEELLRRPNPEVATYARVEAVDVRVSAYGDQHNRAEDLVRAAESTVLAILSKHVWGHGNDTWAQAIGRRLETRGWTLSTLEVATGGSLLALLGDQPWLRFAESFSGSDASPVPGEQAQDDERRLMALADRARVAGGSDVGLAVEIRGHGADTEVLMGMAGSEHERAERTVAFLGGQQGRARAALNAAAFLWRSLPTE